MSYFYSYKLQLNSDDHISYFYSYRLQLNSNDPNLYIYYFKDTLSCMRFLEVILFTTFLLFSDFSQKDMRNVAEKIIVYHALRSYEIRKGRFGGSKEAK